MQLALPTPILGPHKKLGFMLVTAFVFSLIWDYLQDSKQYTCANIF